MFSFDLGKKPCSFFPRLFPLGKNLIKGKRRASATSVLMGMRGCGGWGEGSRVLWLASLRGVGSRRVAGRVAPAGSARMATLTAACGSLPPKGAPARPGLWFSGQGRRCGFPVLWWSTSLTADTQSEPAISPGPFLSSPLPKRRLEKKHLKKTSSLRRQTEKG